MKRTLFIIILILLASQTEGLGQKRKGRYAVPADTLRLDSLEYEIIVLDPGFDAWLATKPSKIFYSQNYYEHKNRLYVSEWNHRYMTSRNNNLYDSYIDYNYNTDYGIDVNYKLYYFFRYFEEKNGVKLINSDR